MECGGGVTVVYKTMCVCVLRTSELVCVCVCVCVRMYVKVGFIFVHSYNYLCKHSSSLFSRSAFSIIVGNLPQG